MARLAATPQRVVLLFLALAASSSADDACNGQAGESCQQAAGEDVTELMQSRVKVTESDYSAELQSKLEAQEVRLRAAERQLRESDDRIAKLEEAVLRLLEDQASSPEAGGSDPGDMSDAEAELDAEVESLLDEVAQPDHDQRASFAVDASVPGESLSEFNASATEATMARKDCRALLSTRLKLEKTQWWSAVKKFVKDSLKKATNPITSQIDKIKKAIKPSTIWKAIKPTFITAMKPLETKIKDAFNGVKNFAMKGIDWLKGLYEKYLKPIINHIGECAKDAGNPMNFIFCMLEPAVKKIMSFLLPGGSVSKEVPFPDEVLEGQWDPNLDAFVKTSKCVNCDPDDPRDTQPSVCRDEEMELGIGTMALKVCDGPFGMDKNKEFHEEIADNLWTCSKKAAVFAVGGIWANISDTLTSGRLGLFSAESIAADAVDLARHLQASATNMTAEAKALIVPFKKTMDSALDNCMSAADASTVLISSMGKVLEQYHLIPAHFARVMQKAEACQEDVSTAFNSLSQLESSNFSTIVDAVKAANLTGRFVEAGQGLKQTLLLLFEEANSIAGSMQSNLEGLIKNVTLPDWKDLALMPLKCAIGKGPYMKMYISFKGSNPVTGMGELFRMSLHQRSGFAVAWRDFKDLESGFVIKSVNYTWEELREATKNNQTVETKFCYIFFCIGIRYRLREDFDDVMGIPLPKWMQINLGNHVYFFSFEVSTFELTLKKIGIPIALPVPVSDIFPEMTLPFLVSIPEPATPPAIPSSQETVVNRTGRAVKVLHEMSNEEKISEAAEAGTLKVKDICEEETAKEGVVNAAEHMLEPDITNDDFIH